MKNSFLFISLCLLYISGTAQTTFTYTGTVQTYIVPSGVTGISVDMVGGQGGCWNDSLGTGYVFYGGLGGRTQAHINVIPGNTIYVFVGGTDTG